MFTGLPLYLIIGLGATTILCGSFGGCQYQRAERYQVEARTAKDANTALLGSVTSKDMVIGELESGLKEWQDHAATQTAVANEVAAKLAFTEEEIRKQQRAITRLEEADRVSPTCQAFLKTDIAQYCPGIATGMRERSANSLQGPTDRSANPGSSEAGR